MESPPGAHVDLRLGEVFDQRRWRAAGDPDTQHVADPDVFTTPCSTPSTKATPTNSK